MAFELAFYVRPLAAREALVKANIGELRGPSLDAVDHRVRFTRAKTDDYVLMAVE